MGAVAAGACSVVGVVVVVWALAHEVRADGHGRRRPERAQDWGDAHLPSRPYAVPAGAPGRGGRLLARAGSAWRVHVELQERLALVRQPWEEDLLHWACDGRGWQLHGRLAPPADGRRRSTTRTGWCPGLRTGPGSGTGGASSRRS